MSLLNKNKSALLSGGKIQEYLLYGIGEIILVVIGILIAVSINNWNDKRKNIRIAEEYLLGITVELERDTLVLRKALNRIDAYIEYKTVGLQSNDLDTFSVEWMEVFANSSYYNIKLNDETFNRMKDDGVLAVRKYQQLFKSINKYYIYHQDYLNNFNEWDVLMARKESAFWEEQGDFEVDFSSMLDSIPMMQSKEDRRNEMIKKYSTIQGRNYAKLSLFRLKSVRKMYNTQKEEGTKLLELLGTEISDEMKM